MRRRAVPPAAPRRGEGRGLDGGWGGSSGLSRVRNDGPTSHLDFSNSCKVLWHKII